jgi:hypothetical protein
VQRAVVEKALVDFNGHRTRVAEALGISVRTLQRKLKAWGMDKSDGTRWKKSHDSNPPVSSSAPSENGAHDGNGAHEATTW